MVPTGRLAPLGARRLLQGGLTEKTRAVDKLWSGPKGSVLGHEFNVNESTAYILRGVFKKETHIK